MRNFKIILVLCVFILNGCTFRDKLWEANIDDGEFAQDLLISEDGSKVVLIGKKYDYFLKDDKKLIQVFTKWGGKDSLSMKINAITAEGEKVDIWIIPQADSKKLSEKQISFLKSITERNYWDKKILVLSSDHLLGYRSPAGLKKSEYESNFVSTGLIKTPHRTSIFEDPTKIQKTGKVFLTPFAIAADIVLLPITLPLFVYQQVKESQTPHFCEGDFCGYDKLKSSNNSKKTP